MKAGINRRQFIGGAGILAAAGMAGMLAGCSQPQANETSENGEANAQEEAHNVSETKECDVLVIGSGASGLAAAVQASEVGANTICIESQSVAGGNMNGVEGCFGVGSRMQKEEGIDVDPGEVIRLEIEQSQYRCSGPGYVDMVHNSGENIDWLLDNGVTFGQVDVDKGDILVFHRFAAGSGGKDYVPAMVAAAEKNGVTFLYETEGTGLVKAEDGSVAGAYAQTKSGDTIQINAKSVIIATGGFADNETYMAACGLEPQSYVIGGVPGHDGLGHQMGIDAGVRDNRGNTAMLAAFKVPTTPGYYDNGKFDFVIGVAAPFAVWVNEKGERFINEDFTATNAMSMTLPTWRNELTYIVMDTPMIEMFLNGDADAQKQLEDAIGEGEIFKADTLEELASQSGIDGASFKETVERYNGFAESGADLDYGKSSEVMMPLASGPFYAIHVIPQVNTSIGSLQTDRTFHAIDENYEPIKGLYVVGVEGAMLWNNIYTINVSGGCNANNVNSGRVAARDAVANL
ncbi:FAD-dependent oxidoreductase [Raoultibacter phocaeensis]|uniref:FAD-dependent oxidoreductase n=1 Tax=Raoultibacter phocaeensis TaxID=2479841 RepID=UPI00111B4BC7|nr:FAD-dependent oxidoreductase [Raoultibacter phocaeensis]